jgi:hypothetical protein
MDPQKQKVRHARSPRCRRASHGAQWPLMSENIQGTLAGYKDMTPADLRAIAQYLKSIPPVRNKIE